MKRGRHLAHRPVSRGWVMPMALAFSLVMGSVAWADDVANNLGASVDATLETLSLTIGGSTGGVGLYVVPRNGDGKNGCNLTGSTTLVVNVTSSAPSIAAASPSSITFGSCGDTPVITVTAVAVGTADISLSQVSNNTGGTFDLAPAGFRVVVNPAEPSDTTPPVITPNVSGTLGNNGWYTSDVDVTWTVTDSESTVSSTTGCGTTTINADTAGQTLTCTATSAGGTSSQSVTIKRDTTAPTISGLRSPAPNSYGWNNTDVAVSFSCGDATSGVASCGSDQTLGGEGAGQSASGTAVDTAGNSASTIVSGINIDKTPPSVSALASPAANGNGWNNGDVTVSFIGTDVLSGIASCDAPVVLSGEGAGQSATGSCSDKAGNSASDTASDIKIDKTAPSVSLVGGPTDGASYYWGFVPPSPSCVASDGLSGIASCSITGYSSGLGTHTVTATAIDNADNQAPASRRYSVSAWTLTGFYSPVEMGAGVLNTVKAGSTVPLKFEVFAGPTELTDVSLVRLSTRQIACSGGTEDPMDVEMLSAGSTSLRYDGDSGQFIQNWKTPKLPGKCYEVTMTASDGSSIVAFFKLK